MACTPRVLFGLFNLPTQRNLTVSIIKIIVFAFLLILSILLFGRFTF
ncbi:MAG TPA: hypothetical protein VF507_05400 [Pyrinomonadaceae bacterium]